MSKVGNGSVSKFKTTYPVQYHAGYIKGEGFYDIALPPKGWTNEDVPQHFNYYERMAFKAGMREGYDTSKREDYKINVLV